MSRALRSWDDAASSSGYRAHIHPSGAVSDAAYEASGMFLFDLLRPILGANRSQRIVDVGCGDGRVTVPLACYYSAVVGVDSSPTMLERLRARAPIDAGVIDLESPTIRDVVGEVDACVCLAVLIHLSHADGYRLLEQMADATRPGGLIVLWAPLYAEPREAVSWDDMTVWTLDELVGVCHELGLGVLDALESPGALPTDGSTGPHHGALTVLRRMDR